MSRFMASPLISRSRASIARERAASVNLKRIEGCWMLQATFEEIERWTIGKLVRSGLGKFRLLY